MGSQLLTQNPPLLILTMGVLGLVFGSFIALVSVRLPPGESIVLPRSHCRACRHRLGPADLVPVASWLTQRGRCRYCGARVSRRYVLVELAACAIAICASLASPGWPGVAGAVLGWQLLLIAILDAEHFWLPDELNALLVITGLAATALVSPVSLIDHLVAAVFGFLVLTLFAAAYRRIRGIDGLGSGDPRMVAGIGAWVGWQALPPVLLVASLAGLVMVLLARLAGRDIRLGTPLPFGTFLAAATFVIWLFGGSPTALP